ncbi:protein-glutamine glutaminase family protein [Streptomyces sp. NPDC048370]|uniref:protein-glutamine glutaminase family protein n=1 Tax=Streptomyces sp. NPDC048370 TaxID=3365540 RepID=UPI003720F72F
MRGSARHDKHRRGTAPEAARAAPDRAEAVSGGPGLLQPGRSSDLSALQSNWGNAAVAAAIQRMEAPQGRKRRVSPSAEQQDGSKHVREAESSSEEPESSSMESESEEESEEEREEPFSAEYVEQLGTQQSRTMGLLEQMDEKGAPESAKRVAEDKLEMISLLRNLAPMRSVETVNEARRLIGAKQDSNPKRTYLARLDAQLAYLTEEFPSDGLPTVETVQALWSELQPAFGGAGAQVGEDGCEDRAHAICLALAEASPALAAHHLSKQWATSSGGRLHTEHQWNHHVAASVTTANGVLVIDPVFSRTGPLELSDWARRVQVDVDQDVHQTAWGFLGKPGPDNRPDANSAVGYVGGA